MFLNISLLHGWLTSNIFLEIPFPSGVLGNLTLLQRTRAGCRSCQSGLPTIIPEKYCSRNLTDWVNYTFFFFFLTSLFEILCIPEQLISGCMTSFVLVCHLGFFSKFRNALEQSFSLVNCRLIKLFHNDYNDQFFRWPQSKDGGWPLTIDTESRRTYGRKERYRHGCRR